MIVKSWNVVSVFAWLLLKLCDAHQGTWRLMKTRDVSFFFLEPHLKAALFGFTFIGLRLSPLLLFFYCHSAACDATSSPASPSEALITAVYMHIAFICTFIFLFFFFTASIVGILLPAKGLNLNRLFGLLWSSWLRFWHFIPFKSPFSGGFKCILTTPLHWCLKGWGQDAAPRRDTVVF